MTKLQARFDEFQKLAFPKLGKQVGDFPLYDSLIAGAVMTILSGRNIASKELPILDCESTQFIHALRKKVNMSPDEVAFLQYCEALEELNQLALQEVDGAT